MQRQWPAPCSLSSALLLDISTNQSGKRKAVKKGPALRCKEDRSSCSTNHPLLSATTFTLPCPFFLAVDASDARQVDLTGTVFRRRRPGMVPRAM